METRKEIVQKMRLQGQQKKRRKNIFFFKKKMLTKIGVPLRPFYGAISFLVR